MDRFLEESVSKHHRAAEEVLYYASWVVMIVSAILAFMYLNVMFYSFSISMLVMTLVFTGIAVYIFFFHDRLRTEYDYTFTNGSMDFAQVFNNRKRKAQENKLLCDLGIVLNTPKTITKCIQNIFFLGLQLQTFIIIIHSKTPF